MQKKLGGDNAAVIKEAVPVIPDFSTTENLPKQNYTNWEDTKLSETNDKIKITEPVHFQSINYQTAWFLKTCCWVTDLRIERHNNLNFAINDDNNIWILPKNKAVTTAFMKESLSKINSHGDISFINTQQDPSHQGIQKVIDIFLPSDKQIFDLIFRNHPVYPHSDIRLPKDYWWRIKYSDKGRSLLTVINFFGSLYEAFMYIDDPFWYEVLGDLGDRRKLKTSGDTIKSLITKINKHKLKTLSEERIAEKIIDYSADITQKEESISIKLLESKVREQIQEKKLNLAVDESVEEYLKSVILKDLSFLVRRKILFQVCKIKCKACGNNPWISVDELKLLNLCTVCQNQTQIDLADVTWKFIINGAISRHLHEHSIAELWTLGKLLIKSRESFFYIPQTDIDLGKNTKKEVDIIAVQDGMLILGEAKKKASEFTKKDIDKLLEISEIINPDKIILSYLESDKDISRFKTKIVSKGFAVEIMKPS